MLDHLHIRNFVIVDELELTFGAGMTALTGETGAGKSILLDAIGLALGDRADSGMVRQGCDRAEVSADFHIAALPTVLAWLRERELDDGERCLIRRTVSADGRSRGYINGQPQPLTALRELGERLVDLHGQHEHQSLLRPQAQRELLDAFGGLSQAAAELAATQRQWRRLSDELQRLEQAQHDREARLDLLRFHVTELSALDLQHDELEQLEAEHCRLANAGRLIQGCEQLLLLLDEGEEVAASQLIGRAASECAALAELDERLGALPDLLNGALIQMEEAVSGLRRYLGGQELDPTRLHEVEQRLSEIHDLARKHRVEPQHLPDLLTTLQQELDQLDAADEQLESLRQAIVQHHQDYLVQAERLSAGRREAAARLTEQVTEQMQGLGMAGGRIEIALHPRDPADGLPPHGLESVEFLVAANPGQPPRPLNKVASGGELSRISLAIQVCSAGQALLPTLIFDEVDVGIGGGVAEIVGRQLHALGGSERQVLCVTHLPQVAAQADHHLQVSKRQSADSTCTTIVALEPSARVDEIARMLGGVEITEQSRAHAREMLAVDPTGS